MLMARCAGAAKEAEGALQQLRQDDAAELATALQVSTQREQQQLQAAAAAADLLAVQKAAQQRERQLLVKRKELEAAARATIQQLEVRVASLHASSSSSTPIFHCGSACALQLLLHCHWCCITTSALHVAQGDA